MGVEIVTTEIVTCKHCGSKAVVKYGNYKGVPRYLCKICHRKFKKDDNQFKMRLPTEQMATTLHDYYDGGSSVRSIGRHILQETGSTPSTATIYEWIQRYTQYITDSIKGYHPEVGDVWIADETVLKINGHNVWLWDIIDERTRFLLASRLSRSRTTKDAQILMDRAIKTAGKSPETVLTDKLASYLDVNYGKGAEHRQGSPFATKEDSTSRIERWHGTMKARTKVMRGLKNYETAHDFVAGFLAFYNYLRPHESLESKTPAEVAWITYPYRNWDDLIRNHKPTTKITIEHQPRERVRLTPPIQIGRPRKVRVRESRPRMTPKPPRITPMSPIYEGHGVVSRHPFRGGRRRGRAL